MNEVANSPDPTDAAIAAAVAPSPLAVEHLAKRFGEVTALDDITLHLEPGELVAVVGPSGCGKSTLLRTIAGLLAPDGGRVALGGQLVDDGTIRIPPERRAVGLVFQDHALFPHLTVNENVGFGIRNPGGRRASGRELRDRVAEMLDLVGLDRHGDRYPHELSGGERQRVALARALAPGPALMLFDEPFASIDHNLRVRLRADVVAALRATGTPALFVTHDQAEALAIGDRIAVLRRGRIAQIGAPAAVFHHPADRFVGGFMGEASFLPIERDGVDGAAPRTALGSIGTSASHGPGAVGSDMVAMTRPDDLRFVPTTGAAQPAERIERVAGSDRVREEGGDVASAGPSRDAGSDRVREEGGDVASAAPSGVPGSESAHAEGGVVAGAAVGTMGSGGGRAEGGVVAGAAVGEMRSGGAHAEGGVVADAAPAGLPSGVGGSGAVRAHGEVTAREYRGSGWLLTVRLDAGPDVLVAASHLDAPVPGTRGRVELIEGHQQVICPDRTDAAADRPGSTEMPASGDR